MAPKTDRLALRLGALFALFGTILGAMAAHKGDGFLCDYLIRNGRLEAWHNAVTYQWLHALALLAVGQCATARRGIVICWLIGVVLFSGSLYILALDPSQKWAGPITPLGGLMFIVGWAWLWFSLLKKPATQ
jgi:uncharacterized membrane protein YgdD (TMEM256/DUF423 family)